MGHVYKYITQGYFVVIVQALQPFVGSNPKPEGLEQQ